MSVINSIRNYMIKCPFLKDWKVNVDYIGVEASYSINPLPSDPVIKRYTDGTEIKQYLFEFASKESFDSDQLDRIESSGFYEKLESWVKNNNDSDIYPEMENNRIPISVDVVQSGYLFEVDDKAQYHIVLRLRYEEI